MDRDLAGAEDLVSGLNALDSGDDGSMSDVEEDQEAFYAVFPQAPNLAKHHALRPLVDALRGLLARPEHLLAALLQNAPLAALDPNALEQKTRALTQQQLKEALSTEQWQHATDFLKRRSSHDDRWTPQQLVQQVDEMMLKLTVYYAHLWTYTCASAVRNVFQVESAVLKLHAQWTAGMAPPFSASDAASQHRVNASKLPVLEETSLCRPLRLRSQTAAAARATSETANEQSCVAAADALGQEQEESDEKKAAAYRRARLAREANEFLIAWFLHHKAKPYPSQSERAQIANKTGLTEQQVRNWFANMRKRHWKPKGDAKTKKPRCLLDTLLRKSEPTNA